MTPSERKALAAEVRRAHAARAEAEDAWCEVEELLWDVRHPRTWQQTWRRLAFVAEGEPARLAG